METDASDYGIGAYLFQTLDDKQVPIAFLSKALSAIQQRWDTPEKESYAIFFAIRKFAYLLNGVKFTLRTDHKNLTYLKTSTESKVYRWNLYLQEFDYNIEYIRGAENVVADTFSRICTIFISDQFQSEKLPRDIYKLISKYHNSFIGHGGVDRTLQKLSHDGHTWDKMRAHVSMFIRKLCPCCEKMSYLKTPICAIPYTLASYSPMERVSIDTIGPLPSDDRGNCYIIVIIDNFSRFVELYPVPNAGAEYAATTLVSHIGRYGAPAHLHSDGGKQFVNNILAELILLVGTEHVVTTAYSHEENGLVERANKEVMRYLRALLFDKNIYTEWATYLPLVQRIINSEVHSSTGVSPAQIIYGNALTLDRDVYHAPSATDVQPCRTLFAYMAKLLLKQKSIIDIATKNQRYRDELSLRAGQSILATEFPITRTVLHQLNSIRLNEAL